MEKEIKKIATRDAYKEMLLELGEKDERIVVLDADLAKSTRTWYFGQKFPHRFFDMGVAEQDMIATAAGLATVGKVAFASTFAVFGSGRAWDQVRVSVAYPRLNVKIVVTHGGITVGEDGPTHQANEDLAIMRAIPNMMVLVPADAYEAKAIIRKIAAAYGPAYVRLSRSETPLVYDSEPEVELGKGVLLRDGSDVTIVAAGIMVAESLEAAKILEQEDKINVRVVNIHTLKPIDKEILIKAAKETGAVVTAEEHSIIGGLGSAVSEVLMEEAPVPLKRVGIADMFCESGQPRDLMVKYGIVKEDIAQAVRSVLRRK